MIKTPKERDLQRKQTEDKFKKLFDFHKANFNAISATEEGLDVLRFIMEFCSYQKVTITVDPVTNEINTKMSQFLEARRGVYLELRKYISPKFLKRIEFK